MGIFDFLKNSCTQQAQKSSLDIDIPCIPQAERPLPDPSPAEDQQEPITHAVYYAYGHVAKIFPPPPNGKYYEYRDVINKATSIVSDGVHYDLTDKSSIASIQVPNYHIYTPNRVGEELGVTGFLEYVLRMHSGLCWSEGEYDIAIACLEKATELMKYSTMGWPPKDFFRIVNELNDLGKFKAAKKWEDWIKQNVPGSIAVLNPSDEEQVAEEAKKSFKAKTKSCEKLGTDLVEVGDIEPCCPICSMYRKRVYSLNGKDTRFPQFPRDFHWGCGLSGWPYLYGIHEPSFPCNDIITYSNRPFIDDRTEEEKLRYDKRMSEAPQEPSVVKEPNLSKIIYLRLKKQLPNLAPKSFSGFQRMRNANSKNYQILVEKAEAEGFVFPSSLAEVAALEDSEGFSPLGKSLLG